MRYAAAKRIGIELSELSSLEHLQGAGPMTLGRLGKRLSMSPGAVTALVDRLESRGYAERIPTPGDRRSMLVRETQKRLEGSLEHLWSYIERMKRIEEVSEEESGDRPFPGRCHGGLSPARGAGGPAAAPA